MVGYLAIVALITTFDHNDEQFGHHLVERNYFHSPRRSSTTTTLGAANSTVGHVATALECAHELSTMELLRKKESQQHEIECEEN